MQPDSELAAPFADVVSRRFDRYAKRIEELVTELYPGERDANVAFFQACLIITGELSWEMFELGRRSTTITPEPRPSRN